jgi:hypothetical protein
MPSVVSEPAASLAVTGILRVRLRPEAEVTIDNAGRGLAAEREFPLAPGPHVVRLTHPDYQPLRRVVTIAAGQTVELNIDWAEKGIRKER